MKNLIKHLTIYKTWYLMFLGVFSMYLIVSGELMEGVIAVGLGMLIGLFILEVRHNGDEY